MEMLRSAATSSSRPGSVYTLDMASSSITGGPSSLPAAPQIARKFTRPWCAPSASRFDSHVKSEDVMGGPRAGLESGTWAGSDSSTISSPAVRSTSTISISRCIVGKGRASPPPPSFLPPASPAIQLRGCKNKKSIQEPRSMQAYGSIPKEAAPVQVCRRRRAHG